MPPSPLISRRAPFSTHTHIPHPQHSGAKFLGLALLLLSLAGCAASGENLAPRAGAALDRKMDLRAGGFRRSYRVHVPRDYSPDRSWPLVVVIHGAFSSARKMEHHSRFSELADREGFIALYPNGMGLFGYLRHWNAGHCCGKAAKDQVDDAGFVMAALEEVREEFNVDPRRIYAAGFSNGGMLVHRLGAEHARVWAALAPHAGAAGGRKDPGTPFWQVPAPEASTSVIIVHGMRDEQVPFTGGPAGGKEGAREYLSAEASARFWARSNGCGDAPEIQDIRDGSVTLTTWKDCRDGTEVRLYALKEWGHVWPGPLFTMETLEEGDPLLDFDTAEITWEFFRTHPK